MPLQGYTCPPWMPTAGDRNEIEWCLGKVPDGAGGFTGCAMPCASPLLLNAMYKAERQNHHVGSYISASMLADGAGCARQVVYERTYPFYEQPVKRWWPFRGTLCHAIIENAGGMEDIGWQQELRMAVELPYPDEPAPELDREGRFTGRFLDEPLSLTLGGTTDANNALLEEIHDFKSMAEAKIEMWGQGDEREGRGPGEPEVKWEQQLNVYGWLVAHTRIPDEYKRAFPRLADREFYPAPKRLIIQGVGMMAIPRTGAPHEIKVKAPGAKWARKATFDFRELPVWPLERTEAFIRPRALQWYKRLVLGEPTPVVPQVKGSDWICKLCCFNGEIIPGERCHPKREYADQQDTLEIVE